MTIKRDGDRVELLSPTELPRASAYLWNKSMLVNVNCRGYVAAQYMQSEVSKYSYAPNIEAKTFMQPEQSYYAHHPGRFFYVKDESNGEIISLPYEPVRTAADEFIFSAGSESVKWRIRYKDIEYTLTLTIPVDDVLELWRLEVCNLGTQTKLLSIYPSFTIGYMSWMNQSAEYNAKLGGVVASCITPYQKLEDYPKIKALRDKTFLLHEKTPVSWEASREVFEGEGGIQRPSAITQQELSKSSAYYETPAAVLQYRELINGGETKCYQFAFGPAKNDEEISRLRQKYFGSDAYESTLDAYRRYQSIGRGVLTASSPDKCFDNFINQWLARQIYYHGDVNRLSHDPQTRNYLQDGMGMSYIRPETTRQVFLEALSQQKENGSMPDGILLHPDATLQYINQIPHTDHCLWLPVCMEAYLNETDDYALLDERVIGRFDNLDKTVFERVTQAVYFLLKNRDERGLSFIAQGDWCDPMNMVGPKGKGVSGWLSIATIYALKVWSEICERQKQLTFAEKLRKEARDLTRDINEHLWDGDWFARGITDDGVHFGIAKDDEGRIFLNPQSWSIMAGCVDDVQRKKIIQAVEDQLETPYGVAMLAPAYTAMREDVGRVTQKYPGSAENGSVYNHAMIFYVFALYCCGESDRAYRLLRQMIPGPDSDDYLRRGQLPVFIPNYYRGAYYQNPDVAGRSSHLFNTGTVAWFYRCLVEGLFGLYGSPDGLVVNPQLPSDWSSAQVVRRFRGAVFNVRYSVDSKTTTKIIHIDDNLLSGNVISTFEPGKEYRIDISLPAAPNGGHKV